MLRIVASAGHLGRVPVLGGVLAAGLGLALAAATFAALPRLEWLAAFWCLLFALVAWALPRALARADIPDREIVIDRVAGSWIAAAPAIPLVGVAATHGPGPALATLAFTLAVYHLILAGPLRAMGRSGRVWPRIGDDLIAGVLAMALVLAAMAVALPALLG